MVLFLTLLLGLLSPVSAEGRVVHLYGRGFSFQVMEPEGWELDTGAAPQIANFIFHPKGQDWRRAESLIVARFIRRDGNQGLEGFMNSSRKEFLDACPFGEVQPYKDAHMSSIEPFKLEDYHCPGVRQELVATGPFSRYFVVFSLSSQQPDGVTAALPALKTILSSFEWVDLPALRDLPAPAPKPDNGQTSRR